MFYSYFVARLGLLVITVIYGKTITMGIEILKTCSLTALEQSAIFKSDELVASVDLVATSQGFTGSWWVSGPNKLGSLSMLFQAQIPVVSTTEDDLEAELFQLAKSHILPIAQVSSTRTHGLSGYWELRDPELRTDLYLKHLGARFNPHLKSNMSPSAQTTQQFHLAKSLNLGTAIRDIAKFQNISALTIETRITRARKAGLIPKANMSSAADIKDHN